MPPDAPANHGHLLWESTLLYHHHQASSLRSCLARGNWHAIKVRKGNKTDVKGYEETKAQNTHH